MFHSLLKAYTKRCFLKAYYRITEICLRDYSETGYAIFKSKEDIANWLQQHNNLLSNKIERDCPWKKSPTEEAFSYYCGYWSEIINTYLRKTQYPLNDFSKEQSHNYIQLIDAEIGRRTLPEKTVVVRWVHYFLFEPSFGLPISQVKNGTVLLDPGYLSTSLYLYYQSGYDSSKRDFSENVLLVIEVPENTNAIYLSSEISDRDEFE